MVTSNSPVAIDPEFLGPLSDRPLASTSKSGAADLLFPGASSFFNARHQRRRVEQMNNVWPLAARLLQKDERVLHVTHAIQIPPTLQLLSMGAMAFHYHQVIMVLTDKRIIEVLLGFRGKTAGTRIRSFPWTSVREMKLRFSKLVMYPAGGKKQSWKVPLRGDRKLLKMLLQRLKSRWLEQGDSAARPVPQFHCPVCGHTLNALKVRPLVGGFTQSPVTEAWVQLGGRLNCVGPIARLAASFAFSVGVRQSATPLLSFVTLPELL